MALLFTEDVACTDKARQEGHLESISPSLQEGAENLGFTEFTDFSRKEWSIFPSASPSGNKKVKFDLWLAQPDSK